MSDESPPPSPTGRPLPPPPPGATHHDHLGAQHQEVPGPLSARGPIVGELTPGWRVALTVTWVLVFVAYLAVWKVSEEIGIGTWWLGPSSTPQPIIVRLSPFVITSVFGAVASFPLRHLPWINVAGAVLLAVFALPDFSRAAGLAVIELAIAGAVLLVSLASLTGRYRPAPAPAPTSTPAPATEVGG